MKSSIVISALLLLASATLAQERITDFNSNVVVNPDRSVDVTEKITVRAQGVNIQRGIFRDIITTTVNDRGRRSYLSLDVKEVLKDGISENYDVQKVNNVHRIRIGSADKILDPGEYTYTIRYNLEQQVRFFDDYDEVYWNVTGNDWQFQIDNARVTVTLPEQAVISQHTGYSGSSGDQGCDCKFNLRSPSVITYTLNAGLSSYQGFTVAVGWQKGVIAPPTEEEIAQEIFDESRGIYYGEIGLIVLVSYLVIAWFFVGRDPRKEGIMPRFDPPEGFSPAACRYVNRMGFDNKAFTACIVSMAVKGYLTINNTKDNYVIKKVGDSTDMLSSGEKKVAQGLFAHRSTITLGDSYNALVSTAIKELKTQLKTEFRKMNFRKNSGWMAPAVIIGIGTWVSVMYFVSDNETLLFPILVGTLLSLFIIPTFITMVRNFINAAGYRKIFAAIPLLFFSGMFVVAPIYVVSAFEFPIGDLANIYGPYILIILGIVGAITLFFYLIQAPTVFGRKRMDEIEGLIMFMNAAEKDRLNMLNPPEKTPQLFERLLPYAIALGVENAWGKQFDAILKQAIQNNEYRPTWYDGDITQMGGLSGMTTGLGSSMSSAIGTSATPPSSSGSSGSSGGGSSGGGGGGGGGGGW